jgi:hypothetical protein
MKQKLWVVQFLDDYGNWVVCQTLTDETDGDDLEVACVFFCKQAAKKSMSNWTGGKDDPRYRVVKCKVKVKV